MNIAKQLMLDEEAEFIDKTFVVSRSKNDNGVMRNKFELHAVTRNGIIYVLDREKFINNQPCIITVLVARPKQLSRLYNNVGLKVPKAIMERSKNHYYNNLHKERSAANEDEKGNH